MSIPKLVPVLVAAACVSLLGTPACGFRVVVWDSSATALQTGAAAASLVLALALELGLRPLDLARQLASYALEDVETEFS